MKRYAFILLFACLINCKKKEKTISIDEAKNYYAGIVKAEVGLKNKYKYLTFIINNDLPKSHPLRNFLKDYPLYMDYFLWNYSAASVFDILKKSKDTAEVREKLIHFLQTDSLINSALFPVISGYLRKKNILIKNYSPPLKTIITKQQLIDIGSKFFYPSLDDTVAKKITWYICVGNNPFYADSSIRKNPATEAFCFMTLISHKYRNSRFQADFGKSIEKIEMEIKGIEDANEQLKIARKRMPEEMVKSKDLENVLLSEYKKKKELLPFEVIEN